MLKITNDGIFVDEELKIPTDINLRNESGVVKDIKFVTTAQEVVAEL